jgi:hypothetical protein
MQKLLGYPLKKKREEKLLGYLDANQRRIISSAIAK